MIILKYDSSPILLQSTDCGLTAVRWGALQTNRIPAQGYYLKFEASFCECDHSDFFMWAPGYEANESVLRIWLRNNNNNTNN